MARGGKRGHVEHAPQSRAATIDVAGAALLSTIAIKWGDADQLADLLAIKRTQFRQVGDHRERGHRANAGDTLQDLIFELPAWRSLQQRFDLFVEFGNTILE